MNRNDERVQDNAARDEADRSGDVIGLGGTRVPKEPGDPSASNDPEAVARRRERLRGSDVEEIGSGHGKGATSIDMGSGGEGTGIDRD